MASSASNETIDATVVERLAAEIAETRDELDLELAVMVGGGNIWRGTTGAGAGMDRATSDTMGMLGTVINALALQDALEHHGQPTRVVRRADGQRPSPIRRRAIRHLEKGRVVVFAAGWKSILPRTRRRPRGAEIEAELLCKGTRGVVTVSTRPTPDLDPTATRYDEVSFMEVVSGTSGSWTSPPSLLHDNGLPIRVFDLMAPGNPARLGGDPIGTRSDEVLGGVRSQVVPYPCWLQLHG